MVDQHSYGNGISKKCNEDAAKVIILCGGKGTRLKEETEFIPKPLVQVGSRPVLWHIMNTYAHFGYKDFVLCLGYKGHLIKKHFLDYEVVSNDFTISLGNCKDITFHNNHTEKDWRITFADTGEDTQTGGRIKRVEQYVDTELFMVTYGDGVGNIDIGELVRFHKDHGRIGTITGVHPSSRFGELDIEGSVVKSFLEKPQTKEGLINGGFFVFGRKFFDYLGSDEDCYLEKEPLEKLAAAGELMLYRHDDFWQCVDTYRELEMLNKLWRLPNPPWKFDEE